jgi:Retrotransposon gag protein
MSNDRAFEDGQRLLKLKQTRTTREYSSEFRAIASRLGWNDAALKFYFYQGLSDKVKDIICMKEEPNTLEEYIQRAQAIDDRLLEREEEKRMTSR